MSRPAGWHHTPEARAKMRQAMLGKHLSPEHREKMSAAMRAAWSRPEYREQIGAAKLGKPGHPQSLETRAKISAAQRAARSRPEVRERMSTLSRTRWADPEYRAKKSRAAKEQWKSPEFRAKVNESHGRPEWRAKRSGPNNPMKCLEVRAKHKEALSRPEVRDKMRAANTEMLERPEFLARRNAAIKEALNLPEVRAKVSGPNNWNWKNGASFYPYCPKFNEAFKERVRAFWGRTCCLCTTPENGKALSVHHVHANKEACCDERSPRQFVALCTSCHSKAGGKGARAEEYRVHFQEMIALRGGQCYLSKPMEGVR